MDYVWTLILGACAGLIIGILIGLECAVKADVNRQVDDLNSQAQTHLAELEKKQKQVHVLRLKADVVRRGIQSKLNELANQE